MAWSPETVKAKGDGYPTSRVPVTFGSSALTSVPKADSDLRAVDG
jgi:hypothetical protein